MQVLQPAHAHAAPGGDRILKQRVLSWLQSGQPQDAACKPARAEDDAPHLPVVAQGLQRQQYDSTALLPNSSSTCQEAAQVSCNMSPQGAAGGAPRSGLQCRVPQQSQDTPAYKRAAALWKKWKSALLSKKGPEKLNAKVLSKHQQLLRPSVDSSSFQPHAAPPTAVPPNRSQEANLRGCQLPGAFSAGAGMPSGVEAAYQSSLYDLTPQSSAPVTPKALGHSAAPATHTGRGSGSYRARGPSAAVAAATAATGPGSPADSPHSAENANGYAPLWTETSAGSGTGSSCALVSPHTPIATVAGLPALQHIYSGSTNTTTATGVTTAAAAAAAAGGMCRSPSQPTEPIAESEAVESLTAPRLSAAAAAEVAALHRTLCGTAMTAYPAVAAALQQQGLGLPDTWPATNPSTKSGSKTTRVATANPQPSPRVAATAADLGQHLRGSPFPGPSPVNGAGLQTLRETAEVSRWLLRAALLEDELQGRALEVREQLDQLADRKEEVTALLLGMTGCRGGAGSAGSTDPTSAAHRVDVMRQQLSQEMRSTTAAMAQLAARAARLGSCLACLQGCQTVMHGSRGARLTAASKLAVLQLVLSDVVARLPGEGLHVLEVCQGLPGLQLEEQQTSEQPAVRCSMAGSFSMSDVTDAVTEAGSGLPAPLPVLAKVVEDEKGCTTLVAIDSNPALNMEPAVRQRQKLLPSVVNPSGDTHGVPGTALSMPLQLPSNPAASSAAAAWQQQQQEQQWQPQYLQPDCDAIGMWSSDDDQDDEVMVTLSSVLSLKQYTPRPSLAYESRRSSFASASVAASVTASVAASATAASVDHAHTTAAVEPAGAPGTRHGGYWAMFNERARPSRTRSSLPGLLSVQQRGGPAAAASAAAPHTSSSSLYSWSRSSLAGLAAQQQLPQTAWQQSMDAAIAAAAVTAKAVLETSDSIIEKAADAAARVSAAWPKGLGEGGDRTDEAACLDVNVLLQQPLADVPEEAGSEASWHSAAESALGSVRSSMASSACITALSNADLEQALALYSSSNAGAPPQIASPATPNPTSAAVSALEAALGAHAPGVRWPEAAAAPAMPPSQSVPMAPLAEYESATVQQLLPGAGAVDISGMTVGQLLQSLTLAVVRQRQSVAL